MNEDSKKELELLEQQLLDNEEWFLRELDSAKRMIGQMPESAAQQPAAPRASAAATAQPMPGIRNYANGYGQSAPQPRIPEIQAEEETPIPKKKSVKGLLILAGLEIAGILALAAYWVLVLLK